MAIAIDTTGFNGTPLKYARITGIEMGFLSRETKVQLSGYESKQRRLEGGSPFEVLTGTYQMPDPIPENIVAHAYEQLAAQFPDVDFTEV